MSGLCCCSVSSLGESDSEADCCDALLGSDGPAAVLDADDVAKSDANSPAAMACGRAEAQTAAVCSQREQQQLAAFNKRASRMMSSVLLQ